MRKGHFAPYHPNQEDKTGRPAYASFMKLNSSTNNALEDHVNMARVETTITDALLLAEKKRLKSPTSKKRK